MKIPAGKHVSATPIETNLKCQCIGKGCIVHPTRRCNNTAKWSIETTGFNRTFVSCGPCFDYHCPPPKPN